MRNKTNTMMRRNKEGVCLPLRDAHSSFTSSKVPLYVLSRAVQSSKIGSKQVISFLQKIKQHSNYHSGITHSHFVSWQCMEKRLSSLQYNYRNTLGNICNIIVKCMRQVTKGHLYHLFGVSDYYLMYRQRA